MCFELKSSLCSSEQLGKMNVASGGVAENKGPNEIDSANSKRSSSWISTGENGWSHHSLLWSRTNIQASHKEDRLPQNVKFLVLVDTNLQLV